MATKKKVNIFQAKRKAAGLSASAKSKSVRSTSAKAKTATAPEDEENAEGEDVDDEASEDDEEETAEGDEDDVDAEGDDEENEASDEEDDEDAEGDDVEDEAEGDEEEKPAGKKAKASAERNRISAIMRSPAAKALPTLADALAFDTALGAKSALKLLDAANKDVGASAKAPGRRGSAVRDAMNGSAPNPKVTHGRGGKNSEEDEAIAAAVGVAAEFGLAVAPKR